MKRTLLFVLCGAMSLSAFAADQGHGKVNFTGTITDSPCSINPDSVDQTVDLGQIANVSLVDGGASPEKPFAIELEDCAFSIPTDGDSLNNKLTITFSGRSAGFNDLLGVTGFGNASSKTAENVGIQINDASNKQVVMGQPINYENLALQNGNNTLLFSAFLKGKAETKDGEIPLGDFWGVTNFTLEYN